MTLKRFCLVLLLGLVCLIGASGALADAPDRPVRVLLSRLGVTTQMNIVVDGAYTLGSPEDPALVFAPGSRIVVELKEGKLYAHYEGMTWKAGDEMRFNRYSQSGDQPNGLRLQSSASYYEGDLHLTVKDGVIRPILHIHLDDYVKGVIPYEMGDSFPLEALKVQAVAARTYAAYQMNDRRDYDVVDTTGDQVFKGSSPTHEKSNQAADATRGQMLYYKNKLAKCYYSASNGGTMETALNVFEDKGMGYTVHKEDPYDLSNPLSVVKLCVLPKDAPWTDRLTQVLAPYLMDALKAEGFDPQTEHLRIDGVSALEMTQPKYKKDSRLMTHLTMTLHISGKRQVIPLPQMPDEEVYLTPTSQPVQTPAPTPVPTPYYTDFTPLKEPVTLTVPFFGDIEKAMGLSINAKDNEIITVVETEDAFRLESRRFGHGVGMSQRGAQWMADREKMTYTQILDFYYPGAELKTLDLKQDQRPTLEPYLQATPGPKPTATPRPTLMPVTQPLPQGAWYASVTEIDDDSSLNLRSQPNTGCDIVMRLYKHQRLIVLEECQEEGWVKVKTDAAEGYVMASYLTQEKE